MLARPNRPKSVTLVAGSVFIIGLANIWRAVALARRSDVLLELGAAFDPRVRLAVAMLWAVVMLGLAIVWWWSVGGWIRPILPRLTPVLLLAYVLYQTAQTILFTGSLPNPLVALLAPAAVVGVAWAVHRPDVRRYLLRRTEQPHWQKEVHKAHG